MSEEVYQPLTSETLPMRLGNIKSITAHIGEDVQEWKVTEVGDGNLNLVFVVSGNGADATPMLLHWLRCCLATSLTTSVVGLLCGCSA